MTVHCPQRCGYTFTYDPDDVDALRAECETGTEYTNGWNLLSVIEFPLREHMRTSHAHSEVVRYTKERWWL